MSDPTFAVKDPALVRAEVLARFKINTGISLAPGDPRLLLLDGILLELTQQRAIIDYSGKQNLLRYVGPLFIDELVALIGGARLPAKPSTTILRFTPAVVGGVITIGAGTLAGFAGSEWGVDETDSSEPGALFLDCRASCTVPGIATNGVAIGQIDTLVDPNQAPGIASVSNLTETISGRELESVEAFRERSRDTPEDSSTAGPRVAYIANARAISSSVADAVALGPYDAGSMEGTSPNPGEVHVLVIEGTRDVAGVVDSVIPDPSDGLLAEVLAGLSDETVRPLGDYVFTEAPLFVDFDLAVTYYIARSRRDFSVAIQAAVVLAFAAYQLWQQAKIGRSINPSQLDTMLVLAGAKRTVIASPAYVALKRDQSARLVYLSLTFGGVEDD